MGHQRGWGLGIFGLQFSWHLGSERSVGARKRHRAVNETKRNILGSLRDFLVDLEDCKALFGIIGTVTAMLDDLRDFKAINWRTDLK